MVNMGQHQKVKQTKKELQINPTLTVFTCGKIKDGMSNLKINTYMVLVLSDLVSIYWLCLCLLSICSLS